MVILGSLKSSCASVALVLLASPSFVQPSHLSTTKIIPPKQLPFGASHPVAHDYGSFSWPIHFFAEIAGNLSSPNHFSQDIVRLLYNLTGAWPHVRIGGTSSDYVTYNTSQEISFLVTGQSYNGIPIGVTIGPAFHEGISNFPGVKWDIQVQFTNDTAAGRANGVEYAKSALLHAKENLYSFEIGNEPDLYPGQNKPANWSVSNYIAEWLPYADQISREVLADNPYGLDHWRHFQALTYAEPGGPGYDNPCCAERAMINGFNVGNTLNRGIDATGHVKSVSVHHYTVGEGWQRLQGSLMNHPAVIANLSQCVFGETNSDASNLNQQQYSGVFGSALWMIDYLMYGMVLGYDRFNLIQGTFFSYTGWVPVEYEGRAPYVRPPLYGHIVVADVIGRHPEIQVTNIDLNHWKLDAYAVYQCRKLSKLVLINLDEWNSTTTYPRPSERFHLELPSVNKYATVKRLQANGANADDNISYGGLSWNYTDGRLGRFGRKASEIVQRKNGIFELALSSSEAVVVRLHDK
ncbi:glycoside hydrolase family 79 protein [Xylogone sp. PMI_703]|nr:glycoside hydrolase family 79 protein [Xylogone sp. PMI_703]